MVKRSPNAFIILIRIGQRTSNVSQLTSYKALLKPKILEIIYVCRNNLV